MTATWLSEESRHALAEEARREDYEDEVWAPEDRDADQAQWLFEWNQGMRP